MNALRRTTGVLGELLITAGALVLLFLVWQLWWTDVTANREQAQIVATLEKGFAQGPSASMPGVSVPGASGNAAVVRGGPPATQKAVPAGEAFAIIRVPRYGKDYARPILQGTGLPILMRGVGHYDGTAMPGQVGNFAVAGHRTTYGRPFHNIDQLRPGDAIIVETKQDYYVYTVRSHAIVAPSRTDVIAPVPEHSGVKPTQRWMTMTSCHPKYSAAERYVSFARFTQKLPRGNGLPTSLLEVKG